MKLLREQIKRINDLLAGAMQAHAAVLHPLSKIPGLDLAAAQELLAEIGPKAAASPLPGILLLGWGSVRAARSQPAFVIVDDRPREIGISSRLVPSGVIHTKGTFVRGVFARLMPRIERKGAAWAVAHRIGKVVWLVLDTGVEYRERGQLSPTKTPARKLCRLVAEFARAGLDAKSILNEPLLNPLATSQAATGLA